MTHKGALETALEAGEWFLKSFKCGPRRFWYSWGAFWNKTPQISRSHLYIHEYTFGSLAACRARPQVLNAAWYQPGNDDEEVQAIPRVSQVALLAKDPQSNHLDDHLHGKEGKDEVIKSLDGNTHTHKKKQQQRFAVSL